jgi:hypothetical protein
MATQPAINQEQLIAQSLGQQMGQPQPGMGGLPFAPTGMPGAPAIDPQMLAQILGSAQPQGMPPGMPGQPPVDPYLQQLQMWDAAGRIGPPPQAPGIPQAPGMPQSPMGL